MSEDSKITDSEFWEQFWKNIKVPVNVDYDFKNDRVIANTIKQFIPKGNFTQKVIEIGCAPGKWLVLFHNELNYLVDGCEYIKSASEKTIQNLEANNLPPNHFKIHQTDFFKFEPSEKYDIVISLGFLEHFTETDDIFQKHLNLLKNDGYLIVGVPNFLGINHFIQKRIDPYLEQKILPNHNLNVMNKKIFQDLANKNGLKIIFNDYIGGFESSLFAFDKVTSTLKKYFLIVLSKMCSIFFNTWNHRLISGYLMNIYQKN